MISLLYILSGLFLGWSLGAKNVPNIFGTAVGTKMVNFRIAAIISGIFVVLGAILQGSGGTETLHKLGPVDAVGGAFTIALCSGFTVILLTHYKFATSTSQAVVGAILGWCIFSKTGIDNKTLGLIAFSWISAPILGAILSPLLFLLLRLYLRWSKLHIIKLDFHLRVALVFVGAFAAYSLGANNIANVMGVFVSSFPEIKLNLGVLSFDSTTLLFSIGGLSIAAGIFTYGRKAMETVENGFMELTPESSIVIVFTQALILFLFSSVALSRFFLSIGFSALPLAPVSSSQVVFGSILGISLLKGVSEVKFNLIGKLLTGWIITPFIAMLTTFFSLFIVQNVFKIVVSNKFIGPETANSSVANKSYEVINVPVSGNITLLIIALTLICALALIVYLQLRKHQLKYHSQSEQRKEESKYNEMHKALTDIEVKTVQLENSALASRLQEKRNEVVNFALNISEQRKFLDSLAGKIEEAYREDETAKRKEVLKEALTTLHQKMSFSHEMDDFYLKAEKVHNDFPAKINVRFPDLTEQEKRLTILLRVGFSSKEISSIMNISPKSVEISRYRLRKKLNIDNKVNLTNFIKSI